MKCSCFIKRWETPTGKPRQEVRSWWHTSDLGTGGDKSSVELLADGYEPCNGTIHASVAAEEEPYYGGTSARLEVSFYCGNCGWKFFPELPDAYTINEFLSSVIGREDGEALRAVAKNKELEAKRQRDESLKRFRREEKEREIAKAAKKAARDAAKAAKVVEKN